jgi:hypothetical protein
VPPPAGASALASSLAAARKLRALDLSGCGISDAGGGALAAALAASGRQLERLSLSGNTQLGDATAQQLAAGGARQLDLAACQVGPRLAARPGSRCGARPACSSSARSWESSCVCSPGRAGDPPAHRPGRGASRVISCHDACHHDVWCRPAHARQPMRVTTLPACRLAAAAALLQVSAAGIQALSSAPGLSRLNLFACPVGDGGGAELARAISAGGFAELRTLSATGCKMGDAGVAALMGAVTAGRPAKLEVRAGWGPGGGVGRGEGGRCCRRWSLPLPALAAAAGAGCY